VIKSWKFRCCAFQLCVKQGSPIFLNLRATSWVLSHTKGTQSDTLFCTNKFAQFAFSYILLLMMNDTHLCKDTDHVNDLKKGGKSCPRRSCALFRTGLRAPHMVPAGSLGPVGTMLVTPGVKYKYAYCVCT
jgi:hypothetical protein